MGGTHRWDHAATAYDFYLKCVTYLLIVSRFHEPADDDKPLYTRAAEEVRKPFQAKPINRDRILVPVSWDSWGKIVAMRDSLDANA